MVQGSKDTLILVVTVLTWLFMGAASAYCAFEEMVNFVEFTRVIILIYMFLFSLIGLAFEARIGFVRNWFTFLTHTAGKSVFLIFLGTLGVSFGFASKPIYRLIPAIAGIVAIVVAILLLVLSFLNKPKAAEPPVELPATGASAV